MNIAKRRHGLLAKAIVLGPNDRIKLVKVYEHQVPTVEEVSLLLDLCEEDSDEELAFLFMSTQMMRQVEIGQLRWPWFKINDDGSKVTHYTHFVYKAGQRRNKLSTTYYLKETKKPVYSDWLNQKIIRYAKTCPVYEQKRLWSWRTRDFFQTRFKAWRRMVKSGVLGPEYNFLLDTYTVTLSGRPNDQFRVNAYSLRRFCITFHYWITYKRDVVKLAEVTAHNLPDTLMKNYIKPFNAIGLSERMIEAGVDIDQFIRLKGKRQRRLTDWDPDWKSRFTSSEQKSLREF